MNNCTHFWFCAGAFGATSKAAAAITKEVAAARPTVQVLGKFTARARSVTSNLASLLTSIDQTKGIRYLTNLIFNLSMSVNGFDDYGHYLRTTLLAGCNSEATTLNQACSANFVDGGATKGTQAKARSLNALERLSAGENPAKVIAQYRRQHPHEKIPGYAP